MTEAQAQNPIHTYETVAGTAPDAHSAHEPRTVVHTVANPSGDTDLFMMTEIGDGIFVQWGECRSCGKRVGSCKCPAGPKEPHYMAPWRDKRFKAGLNDRPNPSHELLPSVITWLRERGYTVTKKGEKAPTPDPLTIDDLVDGDAIDFARETLGEDATDDEVQDLAEVRAARDLKEIDVDF